MEEEKFALSFLILLVALFSVGFASAYVNSTTMTINATNGASGSDWFQGGTNQSINFTFTMVGFNSSTNLTQLNFTSTNFTFWTNGSGTEVSINNAQWLCTKWSANLVNCSGGTDADISLNVTLNVTLNSTGAYEINHTLNVSMLTNGTASINYTNFNIEVDDVTPSPTMPAFTNGTAKKTTDSLTLNVSLGDSGGTGQCWISVNGTNQSFSVNSNQWCNTTVGNLTSLTDANHSISIFVNDSVGHTNISTIYYVMTDDTSPTITHTCTPDPVTQGSLITCTCTVTDATSGVNTTATSYTVNPSTGQTGEYTTTCTSADYTGNTQTSNYLYNVIGGSSSGGGGGGGTTTFWTGGTKIVTEDEFNEGYNYQFQTKQRARVRISGVNHYVGVKSLTGTTATIEVSSTPQEAVLSIGDERKFDVDEDGYYEVLVLLKGISDGKADVTITSINEKITEETETAQQEQEKTAQETKTAEEGGSSTTWWIVLVVVIVLIAAAYGGARARKK